jgi:hypothetical protein
LIAIRRAVVASLAAAAALAVAGPVADAGAAGIITSTLGPCGTTAGPEGQGGPGQTNNQICMGSGLLSVGPSSGQVARVVGPTVAGEAVIGTLIVSAGDAAAG